MIMNATVIRSDPDSLLVRDLSNGNEVKVWTRNARNFSPGETIRITFNGAMTRSIPPQITAISIQRIPTPTPPPQSKPSETRAVVLQIRQNSLLVRERANSNRQLLVQYPYAHHFCVGQQIIVQYDTITMNNPPEIHAVDIRPVC